MSLNGRVDGLVRHFGTAADAAAAAEAEEQKRVEWFYVEFWFVDRAAHAAACAIADVLADFEPGIYDAPEETRLAVIERAGLGDRARALQANFETWFAAQQENPDAVARYVARRHTWQAQKESEFPSWGLPPEDDLSEETADVNKRCRAF